MRRLIALALVVALMVVTAVPAAEAGGAATNIALGLASFAVFNSLFVAPFFYPRYAYAAPAYYYPAYPTYPAVVERPYVVERRYYQTVYVQTPEPAPAPRYSNVVQYPHGRYELRGDGVRTPYQWVWIPNPPPPPPGGSPASGDPVARRD
jgi:hypothetical protein